ncbi:MAG: T9SS type A sorting domain-containing protein [Bacteroidia bacterium]
MFSKKSIYVFALLYSVQKGFFNFFAEISSGLRFPTLPRILELCLILCHDDPLIRFLLPLVLFFSARNHPELNPIAFLNEGVKCPGAFPYSYVLGWGGVEGAIAYQYVVSDNPLCFSGCSGDTREGFTADTLLVSFNMEPDQWYYWITRIIFAAGDTSEWSLISSFFTETPEKTARLLSVAGNPVSGKEIILRFDWAINPEASLTEYQLYDTWGNLMAEGQFLRSAAIRFEEKTLLVPHLPAGLYILKATVGNNLNNRNNRFEIKIILQ